MLVRVLKDRVPCVGRKGETKELPDRYAKVLILIGSVERAEAVPAVAPVVAARRRYARRDMQAESGRASAPRKQRSA